MHRGPTPDAPIPLPELALALALLLMTPGPTSTLMAVAGAEGGVRRAARLIPAEAAAYLAGTLPLAAAGAATTQALPGLRPALTAGAAVRVASIALSLWRLPPAAGATLARGTGRTDALGRAAALWLALLAAGLAYGAAGAA